MGIKRSSATNNSHNPTLFDIRLKSSHKNVILLKGTRSEAPSVLLSGSVVLSLHSPMSVKKLHLKLSGTLRLEFQETYATSTQSYTLPVKYERTVFLYEWDDLLKDSSGSLKTGPNLGRATESDLIPLPTSSKNNFERHGQNTILPSGNHVLPFTLVISGNTLESIEGLIGGSLIYQFESNLERGRFQTPYISRKHVRIIRTLSSDAFDLSESVFIENIWPGKLQYQVEIPVKAIPIGGSTPVKIMLIPMVKGLELVDIKVNLVQYYVFQDSNGRSFSSEKKIFDFQLPHIDPETLRVDKWDINGTIVMPDTLRDVTQKTDIDSFIKVRHKLKFRIILKNNDGHTSEVRASLPITLFISPQYQLKARQVTERDGAFYFTSIDENIFTNAGSNSATVSGITSPVDDAPPNYENRIYDQLYSQSAPVSGAQTPAININDLSITNPITNPGYFDIPIANESTSTPLNITLETPLGSPTGIPLQTPAGSTPQTPSFVGHPPSASDDFRAFQNIPHSSEIENGLNLESLSRVPSYSTAVNENDFLDEFGLAPVYDNDDSTSTSTSLNNQQSNPTTSNNRDSTTSNHQRSISASASTSNGTSIVSSLLKSRHSSGLKLNDLRPSLDRSTSFGNLSNSLQQSFGLKKNNKKKEKVTIS